LHISVVVIKQRLLGLLFVRWNHGNGLSYKSEPGRSALSGFTIGQLLDKTAAEHGDREGLVVKYQNIRRTFAQLKSDVDDLAEGLLEAGLEKGDRIGIWGANSHEWYLTHMAAAKCGFILVGNYSNLVLTKKMIYNGVNHAICYRSI